MCFARQAAWYDMREVLRDDPIQFALGLTAIVVGAEPAGYIAGLSVGNGDNIRFPSIPDNIVGVKATIARIEMPVGPNKGRGIDVQPITDGSARQFSQIGVTEQNRLCCIVETQLVEMFMGAP